MPRNIIDFWKKMNNSHSAKSHGIYAIKELHDLPESPGIYSWHLITESLFFNDYYKMFHQKKVSVNVKGNLKEIFKGEARRVFNEKDYYSPSIDYDLCEYASHVFCPPLYIGISKKLKTRLNTHYRELQKIYNGKIKLEPPQKLGQTDFDTIVESSHFAQRMGFSLKSFANLNLNALYIKTVELDNSYTWPDLQRVEKYLNRTYIPLYGRK